MAPASLADWLVFAAPPLILGGAVATLLNPLVQWALLRLVSAETAVGISGGFPTVSVVDPDSLPDSTLRLVVIAPIVIGTATYAGAAWTMLESGFLTRWTLFCMMAGAGTALLTLRDGTVVLALLDPAPAREYVRPGRTPPSIREALEIADYSSQSSGMRRLSSGMKRWSDIGQRIPTAVRNRFAIDTRSLAAFRVLVGILLVSDVLLRARNFVFFYTDRGAVPVDLAIAQAPPDAFSLYFLSGSLEWTGGLMALQVLSGIALIIGWQTRVATVLAFVLAVSLDHRNVLVTSYADTLFRHLLFFAIFLPLGERWSIDAIHRKRDPHREVVSLASALILLQMVLMYSVTGYHKLQSELWLSGNAMPVVLAHDSITFLLGDFVSSFPPSFLALGGVSWLALLCLSALLLVFVGRFRVALVALFLATHGLLAVTVRIGQFSYVAIGGLLLFLPAVFWRDIARIASRAGFSIARVRQQVRRLAERLASVLPSPSTHRFDWNRARRTLSVVVVAVLLVWGADMAVVTLQTTDQIPDDAVPYQDDVDRLKEAFGVEQPPWTIFAPNPSATDEWFVVAVETQSGYRYDLHTERPLSADRPEPLNTQWDTYRERFYWDELGQEDVAAAYRRFVCRGGDPQVSDVAYITVYQITEVIESDRPETYWNPSSRERNTDRLYTGACGDRQPRQVPLSP